MTQKRKAELQRKLSMAPVAKPPDGLSDRIKADIPGYLSAERERQRLSQSVAFSLRVAASIVLLVTSVFLAIQLLSRDGATPVDVMASKEAAPAALDSGPQIAPPPPPPAAAPQSAAVEADAEPQARPSRVETAVGARRMSEPAAAARGRVAEVETKDERSQRADHAQPMMADNMTEGVVGGIVGGVTAPAAAPPPPPQLAKAAESAPVVAEASRDERAQRSVPASDPVVRQRTADASTTRVLATSAGAPSPAELQKADEVFGISTDPGAFTRVKDILERGEKPPAGAIDVPALINYFAGSPEQWPREVAMTVEASRAPLASEVSMIRFTIDSSIAVQVRLTVEVNDSALVAHRFVSGVRLAQRFDEKLTPRQSVTGVIEVQPAARLSASRRVATFTLQYLSPTGKPEIIRRVIEVRHLQRPWASSSRRHRLATLGALWSESLRMPESNIDIAAKATELAGEEPTDARAEDLAAAATASSRRRSSGPTGSGL